MKHEQKTNFNAWIFLLYVVCMCRGAKGFHFSVFHFSRHCVFSLLCNGTAKDSVIHYSQVPSGDVIAYCYSPYLDLWKKMAQPSTYFLSCWSMVLALDLALKMPSYL